MTRAAPDPLDNAWLRDARADVTREPATLPRAFSLAARKVGRGPLRPASDPAGIVHGTVDDAARAALVEALVGAVGQREAAPHLRDLYQHGDSAERRGVLRGLDALVGPRRDVLAAELAATGTELAADALRTNDPGLVAAAVGPFGARHLDQHTWRHAVIKLVFMGVSLDAVAGLEERRDAELARMARDLAAERRAAGRPVPDDLARIERSEACASSTRTST